MQSRVQRAEYAIAKVARSQALPGNARPRGSCLAAIQTATNGRSFESLSRARTRCAFAEGVEQLAVGGGRGAAIAAVAEAALSVGRGAAGPLPVVGTAEAEAAE